MRGFAKLNFKKKDKKMVRIQAEKPYFPKRLSYCLIDFHCLEEQG